MLSLVLVAAQAFFYNAVFFSYAPVLTASYGVSPSHVGLYELPFALGNFLGSVLLGPLFDKWGRRPMISITYLLSAVLLTATGTCHSSSLLLKCVLTNFLFRLDVRDLHADSSDADGMLVGDIFH